MTDRGVPDSDMPFFPWPARPDTQALDALLSGTCPPEDAPGELRPVAEVLVALQAPPDRREVGGWGQALTVYRELASRPETPGRLRPRRKARPASLLSTRFAAAAGAAAIAVLGGGVAAAYTGNLPGALQKIAHETIAAPDGHDGSATPATEGSGHSALAAVTGPAYGLCHAYQHAEAHGTASQRAVAFRNLVRAAGGPGNVAAYCAPVARPAPATSPGRRVGQTSSSANPGHGRQPTASPGKPSTPPGKPSTPPGKPTKSPGKPSTSPSSGNGNGNGGVNSNGKSDGK
jgi:hypothetical protein